jgi:hypothetical protein
MRPLVLSGGPAAGKTTCGRVLATERECGAYVDADDIRQLVVSGAATFWTGPEGERQNAVAVSSIGAIGRNLLAADFDLVVADVVTTNTIEVYRAELPRCFVVHLRISLDEAHRRAANRRVYLTDDEFNLLHALAASPPEVDLILDVTAMSLEEQLDAIRAAWHESSGSDK